MRNEAGVSRLFVWTKAGGELRQITSDLFDAANPAWDPNGDYLFYISERSYAPQISSVEWNFATDRSTSIFALALREEVAHPFAPESDEVTVDGNDLMAVYEAVMASLEDSSWQKVKKV